MFTVIKLPTFDCKKFFITTSFMKHILKEVNQFTCIISQQFKKLENQIFCLENT